MSLLHEAIIAEKYGLRLTVDQMADALGLAHAAKARIARETSQAELFSPQNAI